MKCIMTLMLLAATPVAAQVGSAGAVPNGADQPGEPLRLARDAGGALTLTWGASCSSTDFDYSIYSGPLFEIVSDFVERTNFADHEPLACSAGIGQTSATIVPGVDDAYYLVVPHDQFVEGSYGSNSDGLGRPRGAQACRPQAIGCGAVPLNKPPVALPDANTSFIGEPAAIDVMANDFDLDFGPAPISVIDVTLPTSGMTSILPTGQVLYSPWPTFVGVDSFDYTLSDGSAIAVAQVTVTVVPEQPRPTAMLTVFPNTALPGETVMLNWSASGVSATLDGAPVPLSGSLAVRPLMTTTYELNVVGEPGTIPAVAVVQVTLPVCEIPALPAPTVPPCPVWCGSGIVRGFGSAGNLVLAPEDLVHVLILSEGYTQAEHDGGEFDQDIQEWIDGWLVIEPYTTLQEAFCIWEMPITSSQYVSPGEPDPGDTAFLVPITDDGKGVDSVPADGATAQKVWEAAALFPYQPASFYPPGGRMDKLAKNLIPVLLVYDEDGGSFGYSGKAVKLDNPNDEEQRFVAGIAQNRIHEFTHAFSRVRDEYIKDSDGASCGANDETDASAGVTNVVCDADCATVPWTHLMDGTAINPNTADLVGVFGHPVEGFRPEAKCLMNGTADNAAYFGGDGKLRVERMCNFCRELAVFRLLERVHDLDDPETSWSIWKASYRDAYYDAYPFSVPIPVPQENSVGTKLCPLCPATDVCPVCGSGTIEGNEVCDGNDFGGLSCASFGFEMGDLACVANCGSISTAGCSGGVSNLPPGTYAGCLNANQLEDCEDLGPIACAAQYGDGDCLGGPCKITNPGDLTFAVSDPFNLVGEFHPDGNYRDADGNLYYCSDEGGAAVCADDDGWGVCRRCDANDDELNTLLGCSCGSENECESFNAGDPEMGCFGEDFGAGIGYCWDSVPSWRCAEGHCGQAPWYGDDTMYCQYYAEPARCEPFLSCSSPEEIICAEQDLICDCDGGGCPPDPYTDGTCTVECDTSAECSQGFGWPADYCCVNNACEYDPGSC
jgi:hypothetical protein